MRECSFSSDSWPEQVLSRPPQNDQITQNRRFLDDREIGHNRDPAVRNPSRAADQSGGVGAGT
jgi:hypothetical protein